MRATAQPVGQAARDKAAADAMEKARLEAEAKPAQVYIPPPKQEAAPGKKRELMDRPHKPEMFTAVAPVKPGGKDKPPGQKKKKGKKKDAG